MTTPDPSREAGRYEDGTWYWVEREVWANEPKRIAPAMYKADCDAWYSYEFSGIPTRGLVVLEPCQRQAAMAHKGAELEQAHEARRQAQVELADMQEKRNRIGLDIDRALRGEVNEQSPIAGRLKLIADSAAQSVATLRQDAIALNLMRSVGLDKHVARECEQVVRQLLQPAAPKQEGST